MSDSSSRGRSAPAISGLLLLLALGILILGAPIIASYATWFLARHSPATATISVAATVTFLFLLFVGFWKSTRLTVAAGVLIGLLLVVTSGNASAFLIALALLAFTLIAGDGVTRLLRGREAGRGELAISVAAGAAALGGSLLLLGEAGLARPLPLAALGILLLLARWRRIPELWRLLREASRSVLDRRNSVVESVWLTIVGITIAASLLGALRPDVSFDGLAYHLPEIRDFARTGHVEPLGGIYETLLWRNHETYLGLAYMAGGEKAVQLLHFLVGLNLFGVIVALARQFSKRDSFALVLLALVGFPVACAQLKEIYVDLPAALLLTASAVEIAASREEPRRLWLAGFLFGGAVATKIFAVLGGVGLLVLAARRQSGSLQRLSGFILFAALPLLPWFAWSQSRQGFFLSPYSHPLLKGWSQPIGEAIIPERQQTEMRHSGVSGFLRLPYDQTFRTARFVANGGSFTGFLPLLLLVGVFGWGWRRLGLFCVAALAALLPWYLLSSARMITPTIRFLIPLYPLYAVFTAVGLLRLTDDFRGGLGAAAAASMAALSFALPAQLFSTPFDARVALDLVSREEALSAYLPVHPLWRHVQPEDRVLLLGDSDRYHCPANYVLSQSAFSRIDPSRWRNELRRLRISRIVSVDQRYDRDLIDSLGDCVEVIDRHQMAVLYRLSWERDCSHPPANGAH
jgi:dolichyl-phosphate-mannose-protein mannosyltransferase